MKKSILSLGLIVTLAAPYVSAVKIHAGQYGVGVEAEILDQDKGAYTPASKTSNKNEVWKSSLRAATVSFASTLAGNTTKKPGGFPIGAALGSLINVMWTFGSDQEANWTPQVAGNVVGILAAYLVSSIQPSE